ncbi:PaaI family thioesterase [Aeromicrobium wangtongii]|uniref:PaaI family thioesterase n=1 Tax=Aeromicrobium wangtongii TaxID=2969247 RepID=A0ABY5M7C1_9ACTN|nr:PaaI family thioesterase [Aeromicrobium wangtongii]MCD9198648.1 PaaI family thioesterase [Aeromicrobium wangtongii]MCL3818669.1 PaaI family thioesterase [Aeromicrobium wangtongii]UUP12672.1 PaaI family thioesterase [Aeromicrobium wangtongii]
MTITAEDVYALAPYARTLGVTFDSLDASELRTGLAFVPALSTTGGSLHGGALLGLADVSAAVCAVLNAPPGTLPATADSTARFMRPVHGDATAVSRPLQVTRSRVIVEVEISDASGRLCAKVTQSVSLVAPRRTEDVERQFV